MLRVALVSLLVVAGLKGACAGARQPPPSSLAVKLSALSRRRCAAHRARPPAARGRRRPLTRLSTFNHPLFQERCKLGRVGAVLCVQVGQAIAIMDRERRHTTICRPRP